MQREKEKETKENETRGIMAAHSSCRLSHKQATLSITRHKQRLSRQDEETAIPYSFIHDSPLHFVIINSRQNGVLVCHCGQLVRQAEEKKRDREPSTAALCQCTSS